MAKTIALAINEITGNFLLPLYLKIKSEVQALGYNLVIFEGRTLDSPILGEAQQNIIYKMLSSPRIDGVLVISSTLFHFGAKDKQQVFFELVGDKPAVSFNVEIKGVPSVVVDNVTGITELVTHLITEHSCNRIAFVSGPESNIEANQRLDAYITTLTKFNKPVESSLIIQGDLRPEGGITAAKALMNGEVICDGVVFANDDMALTAIRYMSTFKPELLERLCITGFDDIPNARLNVPQLTTSSQPIDKMAVTAVNTLHQTIHGKTVPILRTEQSEMKIRQSCGCFQVDSEPTGAYEMQQYFHKLYEKIQSFNLDVVFEELNNSHSMYSVSNFFIAIFDHYEKVTLNQPLPEKSRLIYKLVDGQHLLEDVNEYVYTAEILPDRYFYGGESTTPWLLKPLCFDGECYGYLVVETEQSMEAYYEAIHLHLCMVLSGILQSGSKFW